MGAVSDDEFESWIKQTFGHKIDKVLLTTVAGVTFDNEDGTNRQSLIGQCVTYQRLSLVAEPENKYDKGAVRVETQDGRMLGYVPRNFGLPFGPDRWHAVVRAITISSDSKPASLCMCVMRKIVDDKSERGAL